jgi:hypothetical protein
MVAAWRVLFKFILPDQLQLSVISGLVAFTRFTGKNINFQVMHSDISSGNSTLAVSSF